MSFYSRWKYTILFAAMGGVMGARLASSGSRAEEITLDLCSVALIVVAVVTLCDSRKFRSTALILGIPATLLALVARLVPEEMSRPAYLAGRGAGALFLGFTIVVLVRAVLTDRQITWDTVLGAFAGYVLIGVVWTNLFCAIELISPGSFAVAGSPADRLSDPVERHTVLEYFSFATLSTLGYGDVTPVSRTARSLAWIEAICGQFYLAVLVAGLVGMRGRGQPGQAKP